MPVLQTQSGTLKIKLFFLFLTQGLIIKLLRNYFIDNLVHDVQEI